MAKRFDCEPEPNEFMEAPCRCDCGNWFDLNDGYNSKQMEGRIICRECKKNEESFQCGDTVFFLQECIINGRTRAYYGDKGTIVNKFGVVNNETTVRVEGKKYPIHHVPINILEKLY